MLEKNVAGMLCTKTFYSLHGSFLCVQSIFCLTSFQSPFYGVKCAHVPYQGTLAKSECILAITRIVRCAQIFGPGLACPN